MGLSPDGVIMPADRACVSHPGIFALRQMGVARIGLTWG